MSDLKELVATEMPFAGGIARVVDVYRGMVYYKSDKTGDIRHKCKISTWNFHAGRRVKPNPKE